MIVICEECGKNYRLNHNLMTSDKAKFVCKACDNIITIIKPKEKEIASESIPQEEIKVKKETINKAISTKKKGVTLLYKMLLLFLLIPGVFMVAASLLYYRQLNNLSSSLIADSKRVVTNLSEEIIADIARSVGKHCKVYLDSHTKLKPKDFNDHKALKKIAFVKVGTTGYTALYEIPKKDGGIWHTWVHPNPAIIGIDMMKLEKKLLNFGGFWEIYTGVQDRKEAKGYYLWKDADGVDRDKFMVCTPIEGTNFVIAATTYIDEFTSPVREMEKRSAETTIKIRYMVLGILALTLLIVCLIVTIYSKILSGRIRSLTDHAERISVGELDADIEVKTNDEIGDLAAAITRMQDSIRFSIERLRRRR